MPKKFDNSNEKKENELSPSEKGFTAFLKRAANFTGFFKFQQSSINKLNGSDLNTKNSSEKHKVLQNNVYDNNSEKLKVLDSEFEEFNKLNDPKEIGSNSAKNIQSYDSKSILEINAKSFGAKKLRPKESNSFILNILKDKEFETPKPDDNKHKPRKE